jgi:hypothetical protein
LYELRRLVMLDQIQEAASPSSRITRCHVNENIDFSLFGWSQNFLQMAETVWYVVITTSYCSRDSVFFLFWP